MKRILGMRTLMHKIEQDGFTGVAESAVESAHGAVEAVGDATHLYEHHRTPKQETQPATDESEQHNSTSETEVKVTANRNAQPALQTLQPPIARPRLFPRQSHIAMPVVMPAANLPRRPVLLDGPMREQMDIAGNRVDKAETTGLAASAAGMIVPMMGGTGRALGTLGSGAALLSGATLGLSAAVEGGIRVAAASSEAHNQQKALALFYVDTVAEQFNIAPEHVTYDHVTSLAQQNPLFRNTLMQAYASIEHNKATDKAAGFVAPAAALGGMAATAAMIGSGPIGWIAGMAGAMGGGIAGDMLTQTMANNHPEHTAQAHIETIAMKVAAADPDAPVTSLDVFKVRIHQKEGVAAQIVERCGKPFEELTMQEQIHLMQQAFPQASQHAVKEAAAIQLGGVDSSMLALHLDICPLMQKTHNVQAMQQPAQTINQAQPPQPVGEHTQRLLNERATALEVGASTLGVV